MFTHCHTIFKNFQIGLFIHDVRISHLGNESQELCSIIVVFYYTLGRLYYIHWATFKKFEIAT